MTNPNFFVLEISKCLIGLFFNNQQIKNDYKRLQKIKVDP